MKKYSAFLILILFGTLMACTYETISPKEVEVPADVSFKDNVLPIFNGSCNTAGCHTNGGVSPNLTPDNAYISLTFFGYLDVDVPEESKLIKKITTGSMKDYATDQDRAIILKWIQQGALDN